MKNQEPHIFKIVMHRKCKTIHHNSSNPHLIELEVFHLYHLHSYINGIYIFAHNQLTIVSQVQKPLVKHSKLDYPNKLKHSFITRTKCCFPRENISYNKRADGVHEAANKLQIQLHDHSNFASEF